MKSEVGLCSKKKSLHTLERVCLVVGSMCVLGGGGGLEPWGGLFTRSSGRGSDTGL